MDGAERGLDDEAVGAAARRILPRLADGQLKRDGGFYAVTSAGGAANGITRRRARLSAAMTACFVRRGWIASVGEGVYRLAEPGRAWLQRAEADALSRFRAQHGEISRDAGGVRREQAGTPLDALLRLETDGVPFLGAPAREAALRLERDFELAQLRPRLTRDLGALPMRSGGNPMASDPTLTAIAAKQRCLAALDAVGTGLADLLFEILLMARGLNEAERLFGWPARSAKTVLRLALERLAAHYGLMSGTRRPGRIEAWRNVA